MGRELRQRKPVSYNESILSLEGGNSTASPEENGGQGALLKFTRTGVNNTARSRSATQPPAGLRQYTRNKVSHR